MTNTFPQYRKYSNNKNYFKLINENEFIEISIIGSRIISHKHQVKIYPDRLLFNDLIEYNNQIIINNAKEFDELLA